MATDENAVVDANTVGGLDISGTPVSEEDDDETSIDLVKSIMKKNSKILEILITFVKKFINKINADQSSHDVITLGYIEKQSAKFLQQTQQLNLKVMSKLQGNEEERNIIMMKMKMGELKYAELHSEYMGRHADYDVDNMNNQEEEDDLYGREEDEMGLEIEDEDTQRANNYMGLSNAEMEEVGIGSYIGDDNNMDDMMESYDG